MHYILLILIGLIILGIAIEYFYVIAIIVGAIIIFKFFSWKGLFFAALLIGGIYLISKIKDKIKNPDKELSVIMEKASKQMLNTKNKIINSTQDTQKKLSDSGILTKEFWKRKINTLLFAKSWIVCQEDSKDETVHNITYNMFETSMLPLRNHPIMSKSTKFKARWLFVLTVFVKKYSDCKWSNEILKDYYVACFKTDGMLNNIKNSIPKEIDIRLEILKLFMTCGLKKNKFYKQIVIDLLFVCNAINNKKRGDVIFAEIASCYFKKHEKFINNFYKSLYENYEKCVLSDCPLEMYWHQNRTFLLKQRKKVLVVANMSAGKSTLINAIIGKKVNQTRSDSCTKKIHYIFNKAFVDGKNIKCDNHLSLNVSLEELLESNEDNKTNYIHMGTSFINSELRSNRIVLIDTPGVNTHSSPDHKEMTEHEIIKNKEDVLLYILNATNIGTEDENQQLLFILQNFKGRIIFAVNKLDQFKAKEDSVIDTLNAVKEDLREKGFLDPTVVPISAYAAYLAKMKLSKTKLNEDEMDEFERISRKMKKAEYQFDTYYPTLIQKSVNQKKDNTAFQILFHSGILQLENTIKQEIKNERCKN